MLYSVDDNYRLMNLQVFETKLYECKHVFRS